MTNSRVTGHDPSSSGLIITGVPLPTSQPGATLTGFARLNTQGSTIEVARLESGGLSYAVDALDDSGKITTTVFLLDKNGATTATVPSTAAVDISPFVAAPTVSSTSSDSASSTTSNTSATSLRNSQTTPPSNVRSTSRATSAVATGASTNGAQISGTPNDTNSTQSGLSNGTIAGIVIGVALGLAIITFLSTCLFMRHRQKAERGYSRKNGRDSGAFELDANGGQQNQLKRGQVALVELSTEKDDLNNHLPQSADDKNVKQRTTAFLEQVGLFVENFYTDRVYDIKSLEKEKLDKFEANNDTDSLYSLLLRSRSSSKIINHALFHAACDAISMSTDADRSFLPSEYIGLPWTMVKASSDTRSRPGFDQALSQWRVLTSYIRPNPLSDETYRAQRDERIRSFIRSFSETFAPWQSTKYTTEERQQSLSAILTEGAELGLFLFSQPSELRFTWPSQTELKAGQIVVCPALTKITDKRGSKLPSPQTLVAELVQKL